MPPTPPPTTLAQYEREAFALYFVNDIRYPYVSATLMSVLAAWLLYGKVSNGIIVLWVVAGIAVNALREAFMVKMKPLLARGLGYAAILRGIALSSLATGISWGAFSVLYFDASDPMTVVVAGTFVIGLVGGAVTPLSIYLPAFYLYVLPTLLPGATILAMTGQPVYLALAGLNMLFLFSMANYAHVTNRLHRESMRLRFENQRLIGDLEVRNAEVEVASRNKSLFLAGVSHDLKQPIRAIAMYTGYLRHSAVGDSSPNSIIQTSEKIDSAVAAIHNQISRLLELSRLESGALPLQQKWINLDDAVAAVHQLLSPQIQAGGLRVRMAMGNQHRVWGDQVMLESILLNLLSNAIKHAQGGRIYIGTRLRTNYPVGQQLCIEIRDSGSGIQPDQLPLLFDAYRSFDDRKSSESHGLGLAIAKAQASHQGWDIAVASAPGCGSTFTLCGLQSD